MWTSSHWEVSACYKGILDTMALSDSYSYVIERDAYDPNFRGQKATKDQVVHYPYDRLGCPDLVYYDTPWKPVVEMWRKGKFQEVVHTEYVLLEVNGLFTYTYSLSARSALCRAQPQNWTTVMQPAGGEGRSAWHREVRPPSVPTRGPGDTSWAARWRPLVTPSVFGDGLRALRLLCPHHRSGPCDRRRPLPAVPEAGGPRPP